MIKSVTILVLSVVLLFNFSSTVFAQDEESFVREAIVSKRDAVILSTLFPGLGQMTQGQKAKGVSFFMAEALSLIVFINAYENYDTNKKTYERDLDIFNNLAKKSGGNYKKTYLDAKDLYDDLKDRNDELDGLHTMRNTALIIGAAVWAYNIIDAVFFTTAPSESKRADVGNKKIEIKSAFIDRNPGIILSKRF